MFFRQPGGAGGSRWPTIMLINVLLVLDLSLESLNRVGRFHTEGHRLTGKSLDEELPGRGIAWPSGYSGSREVAVGVAGR